MPVLWSMPPLVRELREAWPSQIARVPNLTEELEKDFRFGQRISKTDRGYLMGGTIKGGSSSMWYPSTKDEFDAYLEWRRIEGLEEERDDEAYERLKKLLDAYEIELVTHRYPQARRGSGDGKPYTGFGPIYKLSADVLEQLPKSHLARATLERIELGGWGPDSAKASAYANGAVVMYDFAIRGARRTFVGLFLHELGHAHEHAFEAKLKEELHACYRVLAHLDAFLGIEFLLDPNTRKLYQKFVFNEFLAETYLLYTACGRALRSFIESQPDEVRTAWTKVYDRFVETFDGIEYE
jgi:hypothetical protein